MTVGPIGDLGQTSGTSGDPAQNSTAVPSRAEKEIQARQAERHAQLESLREAQLRADEIQAQLEALGIQRAQLQDELLAEQGLQSTQEVIADQNILALQPGSDRAALSAFLSSSTMVDGIESMPEGLWQLVSSPGRTADRSAVAFARTGATVDAQL